MLGAPHGQEPIVNNRHTLRHGSPITGKRALGVGATPHRVSKDPRRWSDVAWVMYATSSARSPAVRLARSFRAAEERCERTPRGAYASGRFGQLIGQREPTPMSDTTE